MSEWPAKEEFAGMLAAAKFSTQRGKML